MQTSYKNGNTKDCKSVKQFWEWILKICNKKWYIIDSEPKSSYSHHDLITFLTKSIESSLWDYADAYILVTGDTAVTRTIAAAGNNLVEINQPLTAAKQVAFRNCASFKDCRTEINDTFVNISMLMYNLIEYSNSYSDTSGSLWDFKRDDAVNNADGTNDDNAPSFIYKSNHFTNTEVNGTKNGVKVAVPLRCLSNFWRSLEMPLNNWKVELSWKWIENCVLTMAAIGANANAISADSATLKITDAKLYVPVVTWSTEDNV